MTMTGCDKVIEYFKFLNSCGWLIQNIYKGDYIPTYLLTRTIYGMDDRLIDKYQYEITLYPKKTKMGYVFFLDDEIYSTEDEVIEGLKNMGIE